MSSKKTSFWFSPQGLAALGLISATVYFLLMEHRQHVFEFFPYLIFLLCPLMHVFMHGSHSKHGEHGGTDESGADQDAYKRGLEEGRKQAEHRDNDE